MAQPQHRWPIAEGARIAAALYCLLVVGCSTPDVESCTGPIECGRDQVCSWDSTCIDLPACSSHDDCPAVQPCSEVRCLDGACVYELPRMCSSLETCTWRGCVEVSRDGAPAGDGGFRTDGEVRLDGCIESAEVCDAYDQDCDTRIDEGLVDCSLCGPTRGDCDGIEDNRCETPLTTIANCGDCGHACTLGDVCELAPACVEGMCVRGLADSSVTCRAPTCESDPAETCTGSATACPPACGCDSEPCCGETCADGLMCRSGRCVGCTTTTPAITGAFGTPGSTAFNMVSAAGTTLTMRTFVPDTGSVSLDGGMSASGEFTPTGGGYLTGVTGSGDQLTFRDSTGGSGSITIVGATLAGGGDAPPIDLGEFGGIIPGWISRIEGAGNTLVFYDSASVFATVTFTGAEVCP